MTVVFVVDGGPEEGMGHIYETLTLCGDLPASEPETVLVQSDGRALRMLREAGVPAEHFTDTDDLVDRLTPLAPSAVVFDHPDLTEPMLGAVADRTPTERVVAIGNTLTNIPANAGAYSDVVVNYSKDVTSFDSRRRDADGTLFLEGPAYFILRSSFDRYRGEWTPAESESGTSTRDGHGTVDRAGSGAVRDVLLMFGGSDPSNYTTRTADRLLASTVEYDVTAILGPGFEHEAELRETLARYDGGPVTVHRDVDDVGQYMVSTDVLLTSPGLSTFEAIYVGCPLAAICQTPAHTKAYRDVRFAYEYEEIDDVDELVGDTYALFTSGFEDRLEVGTRRDEIRDSIMSFVVGPE